MSQTVTPIFLFSLPRSGSTLLQRILAAHPHICTASEPWLLLPMFYALRPKGTYAEYSHHTMQNALADFIAAMPEGRMGYLRQLNSFAARLYAAHTKPGDRYFLDKTPRYHLIVSEILETFPDAKFIFLWRNPLAVIASSLETFGRGKWRLYDYRIDFYKGLSNLHAAFTLNKNRVHSINYEKLIAAPEVELQRLFAYLDLNENLPDINSFSKVKLSGGAGDPTGTKAYQSVSTEPLEKWKTSLCNPVRRAWSRRYIKWIGQPRLADIGYDYNQIMHDINSLDMSSKWLISDTIRISYGAASTLLESHILMAKLRELSRWSGIFSHK